MAVISIKNKIKSGSMLAGNEAFIPNEYESIATAVVGSGGTTAIQFSSIPSTYQHLQIRGIAAGINNDFSDITFNGDTGSNYAFHDIYGDGGSAGAESGANRANIPAVALPNASGVFTGFVIDILDYNNTNKNKTVRIVQGRDANGSGVIYLMSGLWRNTAAITTITFTPRVANIAQHTQFALYGIKG